jgi:hypothetical protein
VAITGISLARCAGGRGIADALDAIAVTPLASRGFAPRELDGPSQARRSRVDVREHG